MYYTCLNDCFFYTWAISCGLFSPGAVHDFSIYWWIKILEIVKGYCGDLNKKKSEKDNEKFNWRYYKFIIPIKGEVILVENVIYKGDTTCMVWINFMNFSSLPFISYSPLDTITVFYMNSKSYW